MIYNCTMETGREMPGRTWFWAKEAAAYIGVHPYTLLLYTKLRKGRPPFKRLGRDRRYRFPKNEFIEWANGLNK